MLKHVLKWGLLIGVVNLVWLYASYYAGLHTSGIAVFQVVPLVWLLLTVFGMVWALRSLRRREPGLSYGRGLAAGFLMSLVSAVVAVIMQVGYFTVIHPAWPEYMIGETRAHFTALGKSEAEVEAAVAQAQQSFTMGMYATQSAIGAVVLGTLVAAIAMIFVRARTSGGPAARAAAEG